MKKYITNSLFVVTPLASAAGINAATTGGFAFSFIAKAVMGLAIGATAQFVLAGAASAALVLLGLFLVSKTLDYATSLAVSSIIRSDWADSLYPADRQFGENSGQGGQGVQGVKFLEADEPDETMVFKRYSGRRRYSDRGQQERERDLSEAAIPSPSKEGRGQSSRGYPRSWD